MCVKRFKSFDTYLQITFHEDGKIAAIICILQIRKLRFRKVKLSVQGHKAGKCQGPSWDETPLPFHCNGVSSMFLVMFIDSARKKKAHDRKCGKCYFCLLFFF